uniref:Uncharacterized protein n=1 Tax=Arundo donax TaxID=35708 RepID=A0A0A8ZZP1_ARUDO
MVWLTAQWEFLIRSRNAGVGRVSSYTMNLSVALQSWGV